MAKRPVKRKRHNPPPSSRRAQEPEQKIQLLRSSVVRLTGAVCVLRAIVDAVAQPVMGETNRKNFRENYASVQKHIDKIAENLGFPLPRKYRRCPIVEQPEWTYGRLKIRAGSSSAKRKASKVSRAASPSG